MFIQLYILSKDKQVLYKFLSFLCKLQKIISNWSVVFTQNKKSVITVLKSPHINKTAQEQFEYRIYSKKISIHSSKPFIFFLILKKLKGLSFSGVSLEVTSWSNKCKNLKLLNSKNIILPIDYKFLNNKKSKQKFIKYIQLFDCHGEKLLKTKFKSIFSSVG